MYFKLNKSFLQKINKKDLVDLFEDLGLRRRDTKAQIILKIIANYTQSEQLGSCNIWALICPYCRTQNFLLTPKKNKLKPRFCLLCGRTSPFHAFENNLEKTIRLVVLASKMNLKVEKITKNVLLEQSLVTVITGLEVLMREAYSLVYDHQHVVLGKSIFNDVYSRTRNEFLNLGSASRWLRKVTRLNIKSELSKDEYKFLSRMYSARHIVVHNSSIKDKDFLSQTGDPDSELNKPLRLKVSSIRKLISVSRRLAQEIDRELRKAMLDFQHERLSLIRTIGGPTS